MIEPSHYPSMSSKERRKIRKEYEEDQGGLCHHCKKALIFRPRQEGRRINWRLFPGGEAGFLRYPVHLHHDHKTGNTIGAVHAYCNAVLWQIYGE